MLIKYEIPFCLQWLFAVGPLEGHLSRPLFILQLRILPRSRGMLRTVPQSIAVLGVPPKHKRKNIDFICPPPTRFAIRRGECHFCLTRLNGQEKVKLQYDYL